MLQKIKASITDFMTVVRDKEASKKHIILVSLNFDQTKRSKAARCVNLCNPIQSLSNLSWGPCQFYNKTCTLSQYFLTYSTYQTSSNFHRLSHFENSFFFFWVRCQRCFGGRTCYPWNVSQSEMPLPLFCSNQLSSVLCKYWL